MDTKNQKPKELENENQAIKKAIWDIINYLSAFIVILDSDMNIKLANWYLANKLGYENEKDLIGLNWLQFIKKEEKVMIKNIHAEITSKNKAEQFREITNEIVSCTGKKIIVRWFNLKINHGLNLSFSFGIPSQSNIEESTEAIRSYYRDIIEKDKTMIKSLLHSIVDDDNICK